jgi:hypothetical protein
VTYVRVTDIAATWADYVPPQGPTPAGLIIFAAGPTDEGIRTVEVWTSAPDRAYLAPANSITREFEAPVAVLGNTPTEEP